MGWRKDLCLLFGGAVLFWGLCSNSVAQVVYKYHEVVAWDTVYSISKYYNVDSSELLRINAQTIINGNGLQTGSILLIPVSSYRQTLEVSPVSEVEIPEPKEVELPETVTPAPKSKPKVTLASSTRQPTRRRRGRRKNNYSIAVGSDGQVVKIPEYVDPHAVEEESAEVEELLEKAKGYMGVPYVWGGTTPSGFDCSSYVQYVYREVGVDLPRTADVQFLVGDKINIGDEKPGDMVFFETYTAGASHVGIYLGDGEFIHASSSGCVKISSLEESYFNQRYLGARRVFKD